MKIKKTWADVIERYHSLDDWDRKDFLLCILPYNLARETEPEETLIEELGEQFWNADIDPDLGDTVRGLIGHSSSEVIAKVCSECAWLNLQPNLQDHLDAQDIPERAVADFLLWEMGRLAGV